tara:strand:- start:2735 stop:2983 length:249 start_codon:yes stop_codon:yes gene_type:complete
MDDVKYTMWAKRACPFCQKAQLFFLDNRLSSTVYFVDENPALLEEKKKEYSWETVPIIVKKAKGAEILIGGYTDLIQHLENE